MYKNIEKYLKEKWLQIPPPTGEILCYQRFFFIRCLLQTVEVTGSNPVSPTTILSILNRNYS
jgi:hypothetical protein